MIDNDANKELFLEQMEIIFKAFNEDSFSHQGRHYTIPARVPYRGYDLEEVTLVPRPIHRPVEIWQPISSGRSLDYMASKGIKAMVALTGEKLVEKMFHEYQDLSAKHGRDLQLGENMALSVGFYLADTQEEAIRRVRDSHDERYKWFAPFGFVRYTNEDGTPWGHTRLSRPHPKNRGWRGPEGVDLRYTGELRGLHQRDARKIPGLGTNTCSVARRHAPQGLQ